MEYIPLICSIISIVFCISTFVVNRKDKAVNDTKEYNMGLIKFRLDQLDSNVQRILSKLDTYDKEFEELIDKRIHEHIELYHKNRRKD